MTEPRTATSSRQTLFSGLPRPRACRLTPIAGLLLGLLSAALPAQQDGRGQLQLADGRVVHGVWTRDGETLLVETRAGLLRVPADQVQGVATTGELRARLRRMAKGADAPHAQLEVARTARDWGLTREMWLQLDELLEAGQDQEAPTTKGHRQRLDRFLAALLPELLGWQEAADLQQQPPAKQALAIAESLGSRSRQSEKAATAAVLSHLDQNAVSRAARQARRPDQRIAAWHGLRLAAARARPETGQGAARPQPATDGQNAQPGEPQQLATPGEGAPPKADAVQAFLFRTCILDRDKGVRRAAAEGIRDAGWSHAAIGYLQPGLLHPDAKVRIRTADAFGAMDDARAIRPLLSAASSAGKGLAGGDGGQGVRAHAAFITQTSYVRDFDVEVASASAIADPKVDVLSSGAVLDVTVSGVSEQRVQILGTYRSALARLGGSDPGANPAGWTDWYAGLLGR